MYDWIIEADIYRLRKAILETRDLKEQRSLSGLVERKERSLTTARAGVPIDHPSKEHRA
jgi:hypothetical protein